VFVFNCQSKKEKKKLNEYELLNALVIRTFVNWNYFLKFLGGSCYREHAVLLSHQEKPVI